MCLENYSWQVYHLMCTNVDQRMHTDLRECKVYPQILFNLQRWNPAMSFINAPTWSSNVVFPTIVTDYITCMGYWLLGGDLQIPSNYNRHSNVIIIMTWLWAGWPRIHGWFPREGRDFSFLQMPRLTPGPNQLSIQWMPRYLSRLTSSKVKVAEAQSWPCTFTQLQG